MPPSFLSFAATLSATLIGVLIAFELDRRAKEAAREDTIRLHLEAISNELESNKETINHNFSVIDELQGGGNGSNHYTLEPYSTGAWDAAVTDQLIEHVNPELYTDLQKLYREVENVNELIKRLRTESLHPDVDEEDSAFGMDWTITVAYWDKSKGRVQNTGLGDLIKNRSNRVNILIDGIEDDIETAIAQMDEDSSQMSDQQIQDYSIIPFR